MAWLTVELEIAGAMVVGLLVVPSINRITTEISGEFLREAGRI